MGLNGVCAVFRVLHTTDHGGGSRDVHIAPTYATRDGQPSERNKSFSKWTPSGTGEFRVSSEAPAAVRELFVPDAYVNLDFGEIGSEQLGGSIRTEWLISEVRLRPDQFDVLFEAVRTGGKKGDPSEANRVLFANGYGEGKLSMQVTNLHALDFFLISPTENGKARKIVIDFSAG